MPTRLAPALLLFLAVACAPRGDVRTPGDDTGEPSDTGADTADTGGTGPQRPDARLDAALTYGGTWGGARRYLFAGEEYVRFDVTAGEVDEGYPLVVETWWDGVDAPVDAAALTDEPVATFFAGSRWVAFDVAQDAAVDGGTLADWPGVWSEGVEAAAALDGDLWLFRGPDVLRWDLQAGAAGADSEPIGDRFGVFPEGVDAALSDGGVIHLFQGERFASWSPEVGIVDEGRSVFRWPGMWDPHEGSGDPGANLPGSVAALLADEPSPAEIAARKERVRQSIEGTSYVDLSEDYPLYLASIEDRLGAWGCLLLHDPSSGVYRFRCATDTAGPRAIAAGPLTVEWIDWRRAAYHEAQASQGDFLADAGTPLSILQSDDGVFRIHSVTANPEAGSIAAGLNVKVRFTLDGAEHVVGFSHLDTAVPDYVLDAAASGDPLPVGTVFGFIGYTGNLWIGPPPPEDGPYGGDGAGLPQAHSHLWFADGDLAGDPANHRTLTRAMREAIDYSGRYPFGGG